MKNAIARAEAKAAREHLELSLLWQIRVYKLPVPVREYKIAKDRDYRWDLAWPSAMLCAEVQGGIYRAKGAHNTASAINRDCEKLNLATLHGWRTLNVTSDHIESGQAIQWIKAALELYPPF